MIDRSERYDTHESLFKRRDVDVPDVRQTSDDAFEFNFEGENEVVGEVEAIDRGGEEAAATIDFKSSLEKTSLGELKSVQGRSPSPSLPSPPSDPLKDFLKSMRAEIEAGRLETNFRIPGIGPPIAPGRVTAVGLWLTDCARRQEGLIGPRNIRHFLCPSLDDISECDFT